MTAVDTAGEQIAGSQPHRFALIISAPQPAGQFATQEDQLVAGASTAATGVKASYTVPAGVTAVLQSASAFVNAGTPPANALQVVRGATTITVASFTGTGTWNGNFSLAAGDKVQWNTTTGGAGSNTDFMIGISQDAQAGRVTVSFTSPPVLDQGMTLYPGGPPLVLLYKDFGDAVREPIWAISANGTQNIALVDVFGSQLQDLVQR